MGQQQQLTTHRREQEQKRLRAAEMFEQGYRQAEVVRALGVSRSAVSKWHTAWQANGREGLAARQVRRWLSLRPHAINGEEILGFLKSLRRHVRGTVILVWDNLPAQTQWLRVKWLPAYAPELNPLEDVWANLDRRELANFIPDDMDQLHRQVTKGARRIRRQSQLIWGFLKHTELISDREIP